MFDRKKSPVISRIAGFMKNIISAPYVRLDFGLGDIFVGGCREQIREIILIRGIRRVFCEKVWLF